MAYIDEVSDANHLSGLSSDLQLEINCSTLLALVLRRPGDTRLPVIAQQILLLLEVSPKFRLTSRQKQDGPVALWRLLVDISGAKKRLCV